MNREIKFRVWHEIEKCFMEVLNDRYHILCQNHGLPLYRLPSEISARRYGFRKNDDDYPFATLSNIFGSPDFYVVQQYTGLKDKNGKEIYEGDIIKATRKWSFNCDVGDVFVVEYNSETASYGLLPDGCVVKPLYENFADLTRRKSLSCEIIGNIFENSELLEK